MKSTVAYLKTHPIAATGFFSVVLVGVVVIGIELRVISQKLHRLEQAGAKAQPERSVSVPLHPVSTAAVDPKLSEFMRQYRLGPKAAKYISQAKMQILEQTDTSVHLSIVFPDKFTVDEVATVAADPSFVPSQADLERAARTGSSVHGAKLTFEDKGPRKWMSTLRYHLPYSVVPRELLQKLQPASNKAGASHFFDLIPEAFAQGEGGGGEGGGSGAGSELTGEMVIAIIANYTAEAYKGLDLGSVKEFKELEEGLEDENAKSLGADLPLAVIDAFEDALKWREWSEKMEKLDDCAKNPNNPLSQKASKDPSYQHDVMDQLEAADSDVFWSFAPQAASDVAGYAAHFLPFGGGVVVGLIFSTQDEAVEQSVDGRIEEASRYVVPCEEQPTKSATFNYLYHSERKGVYTGSTDGHVSGDLDFSSDPGGHGFYAGTGHGQFEWDERAQNTVSKSGYHQHLSGKVEVEVSGRGMPRAAEVTLTIHGENLTRVSSCTGCAQAGGGPEQGTDAQVTKTCNFTGVDFIRGGSYTVPSDLEDGLGTCKLTVPGQ
jgi:hypothetical protein